MCVFVVSAAQIHKANVSVDALLSSLMPLVTLQSLVGLTEKSTIRHSSIVYVISLRLSVYCRIFFCDERR